MIFAASQIEREAILIMTTTRIEGANFLSRERIKMHIKDSAKILHQMSRDKDEEEVVFIERAIEYYEASDNEELKLALKYLIEAVGRFIRSREKGLRKAEEMTEQFRTSIQ